MYTVLIVEDCPITRETLRDCLQAHARISQVLTAPDGIAATVILHDNRVDFVLTDLTMPRMDGYELMEHIRRFYPEIPTCVMTVHEQATEKLIKSGALLVLIKPFSIDEVLNRIIHCIELPKSIHALQEQIDSLQAGIRKHRFSLIRGGKYHSL
ncbi:MAG: response regulator [Proteobacteria bacterium]|nr:response regulator [Pseudomonadota bacterium]MBU1710626.1 response regulator [Pseudomonadota bacterium]